MADKQKAKAPNEERLFTVPLRKQWLRVPMNKRAKRSVRTIRSHLSRHMKVPEADIRVSSGVNKAVWVRGAGKPPSKVRLKAHLDAAEGKLHALLPDEQPPVKEEKKAKEPEGMKGALQQVVDKAKSGQSTEGGKAEMKKAVDEAVKEQKTQEAAPVKSDSGEEVKEQAPKPEEKPPEEKENPPAKRAEKAKVSKVANAASKSKDSKGVPAVPEGNRRKEGEAKK